MLRRSRRKEAEAKAAYPLVTFGFAFTAIFMESAPVIAEGPPLYTARAIRLFSVVFTVIFGGVLLYQNLKDLGQKSAANRVLLFSVAYTVLAIALVSRLPQSTTLTLGVNLIGGYILSWYFIPKYIPEVDRYPAKKVWKPLIISILIILPFLAATLYSLPAGQ
jgi:hypothetical protein